MGVAFLRLLGVSREVSLGLQISAGFCAGLGILSWVLFPIGVMGLFGPVMLWFVLLVGLAGLYFFHPLPPFQTSEITGFCFQCWC